jgi:hypothetical protein
VLDGHPPLQHLVSCRCICRLLTFGRTVTVGVRHDLSAFGGGLTIPSNADDAVNGRGSDQRVFVENRNRYRQRQRDTGAWMDVQDWVILAHELCGHALPAGEGNHPEARPGKPGYSPRWHSRSEQAEDDIRSEHGLPPRGTDHGLRP